MGTPQFAVPSLSRLIDGRHDIAAVITQPDRKSGRGYKLISPPVKTAALNAGVPVLQFEKIKSEDGVRAIRDLSPDLIVTAAFGQIFSKELLDIPPHGCINVHASLLPKYRGAAPIQWAIINGEKQTGVTIMFMDEGLDTGDIIASVSVPIGEDMTGGELYDILAEKGADLLAVVVEDIDANAAARTKQKESEASYYPMLKKELGAICWEKPAEEIRNLVRALDPVMGAYAIMNGCTIKIWRTTALPGRSQPGAVVSANGKDGLIVGTGDGLLRVEELQMPGTKRMSSDAFFRGRKLPGESFR